MKKIIITDYGKTKIESEDENVKSYLDDDTDNYINHLDQRIKPIDKDSLVL